MPVRVVAPTSVNGGSVRRMLRRRRALADHDVELEVLHRRVEDLLHRTRQAVDLVDEQHVAVLELGEDGGEVAGPFERRAGRDVQVHAHLGGDDAGHAWSCRGRAGPASSRWSAGWPRVLAASSTIDEVLLQLALADELAEPARPQADFVGLLVAR